MLVAVVIVLFLAARLFKAGVVNQLSVSTLFGKKAKG
jgi:hypothetical protein